MAVKKFLEFLEILFQRLQHVALVEGSRGVEEGEDHEVLHVKRLRLDLRNPDLPFQQRLSRPIAQRADQLRPDHLNLLHQERLTGFNLVRLRVAVVRRAALDDIGDVNLVPRKARRSEQIVKEFARSAHERLAFLIFVEPGRLAYEHDTCVWIADPEDDLCPAQLSQLAALTIMERFGKFLERR